LLFRSVNESLSEAAANPKSLGVRIGFLAILHTWGQNLHHHPHVCGIFLEGGFDERRRFCHIPFGNLQRMAEVFRRRVIAQFLECRLIDRSRAASMLSWPHSGFSIDGSIGLYAGDQKAMERLARHDRRGVARPEDRECSF
jgi:hypothetical protein